MFTQHGQLNLFLLLALEAQDGIGSISSREWAAIGWVRPEVVGSGLMWMGLGPAGGVGGGGGVEGASMRTWSSFGS